MKTKLQSATLAVIIMIAIASVLTAKAPKYEVQGKLEFSSVVWKRLSVSELYYRMGEEFLPMDISVGQRSELQPLENADFFELHTRKENPDGDVTYELVGRTALVPGTKRLLFTIEEADETAELPLRLRAFDDSLDVFPAGTFRIINDTSDTLQLVFNDVTTELTADAVELVQTDVSKSGGFLPISIQNSEGRRMVETRLLCQANGRKMIFICPPQRAKGRLIVKFLSELISEQSN